MKCFDNNDGRSFGKCCSVGDYEECWTGGRGNPNGAGWRMREFFFCFANVAKFEICHPCRHCVDMYTRCFVGHRSWFKWCIILREMFATWVDFFLLIGLKECWEFRTFDADLYWFPMCTNHDHTWCMSGIHTFTLNLRFLSISKWLSNLNNMIICYVLFKSCCVLFLFFNYEEIAIWVFVCIYAPSIFHQSNWHLTI